MEESKPKDLKEEPVQIIHEFNCKSCDISEKVQYKGVKPPFSRNIVLKYPSYVMKDPFSPPGKGEILVLGADCVVCNKPVCLNKDCSMFYIKTYCLDCANKCTDEFPIEIKSKLTQLNKK